MTEIIAFHVEAEIEFERMMHGRHACQQVEDTRFIASSASYAYFYKRPPRYRMYRRTTYPVSSRKKQLSWGIVVENAESMLKHSSRLEIGTPKERRCHENCELSKIHDHLPGSLPRGESNAPSSSSYHGDAVIRLGPHGS